MAVDLKQLKQGGATSGQVVGWSGTTWAPQTGAGTLDTAYDFGGSGAGRVITADAGAVHIDKSGVNANNALEVSVTAGSGAGLSITHTGTGLALLVVYSGTGAGGACTIQNAGASTGPALFLDDTGAANRDVLQVTKEPSGTQSGHGINVSMNTNTTGSGIFSSTSGVGYGLSVQRAGTTSDYAAFFQNNGANNGGVCSITKNPAGTQSGNGLDVTMGAATTGSGIYVNAATGATGLLLRLQVNAVNAFTFDTSGKLTLTTLASDADLSFKRATSTAAGFIGTVNTSLGNMSSASVTYCTAIGAEAQATASDATAVGGGAVAAFIGSIAIGVSSTTTAANQLVVGSDSEAITNVYFGEGVSNATPLAYTIHATGGSGAGVAGADIYIAGGISGDAATAGGVIKFKTARAGSGTSLTDAVTISNTGTISCLGAGSNSERFGAGAAAGGASSLAVGNGASAAASHSLAIGTTAVVGSSASDSLAIGYGATIFNSAGAAQSTAVGVGALAGSSGSFGTAFGNGANAENGIAIGVNALASGNAVAIGTNASSTFQGSIVIAYNNGASTATNQFVVGADQPGSRIDDTYIGKGVESATPSSFVTIHATNGVGTNIAASSLVLAAGVSTGSASPADYILTTTYPGTTGTTAQTTNNRYQARGKPVTLVNNTATEIFNIDVPNNSGRVGITIQYTVVYDDGTDYQTETGFVTLSTAQVAATFFTNTTKFGNAQVVSSGTLTVTASVTNNTNNVSLKLNANSSLTPTVLRCFVQVMNNSDKDPVFA